MIQPIKSIPTAWNLHWVEVGGTPVPEGELFFLPTLILVTDDRGRLLNEPLVLQELDQSRVEEMLCQLFEKTGVPRQLIVAFSEDWDENVWRRFSADYKLEIRFATMPTRSPTDLALLAEKVEEVYLARTGLLDATSDQVAYGLIDMAMRVRSTSKRHLLLHKALELDPHSAKARIELADMAFQAGDWSTSLRVYEEVLSMERASFAANTHPWVDVETRPFLRAQMGRAMVLWQQEQFAEAAQDLNYLLKVNPSDNQGVRFCFPMLLLLSEEYEAAAAYFRQYEIAYPGDYPEPAFLFGWALTLSVTDHELAARKKYREAMVRNLYIAPILLEKPEPSALIWYSNERTEPSYASEFVDSYAVLWDRNLVLIRHLRDAYTEFLPYLEEIVTLRKAMLDFQDQRYEVDYRSKWKQLLKQDEALIAGAATWQSM